MVRRLRLALDEYENEHPSARASLYRRNPGAIYIRIVDDHFARVSRWRRHSQVWRFLTDRVGDDDMGEVALLLPLSKAEMKKSMANMEFEFVVTELVEPAFAKRASDQ